MSLVPAEVDFRNADRILQGTDWSREIPMGVDLTAYNPDITPGAVLRGSVKSKDRGTTYLSTEAGTMRVYFKDPTTLVVSFTAAGTSACIPFKGAIWDIEGVNGYTLLVDRLVQGKADNYREVTTEET